MKLIFCSDPLYPRKIDPVYAAEAQAATEAGFDFAFLNFEALVANDMAEAVKRIPIEATPQLALYRGWMLLPVTYAQLYSVLATHNIRLLNDPAAYIHCHYLPSSYSLIQDQTPPTTWIKTTSDVSFDAIMDLLQPFGAKPLIVKDFVKSRKHEWFEACYIPAANDRTAVERVVSRFLALQGDDLNEGLVFREYVEFEPLTTHSKSRMPLTKEYRLIFLDHRLLVALNYWDEGDYAEDILPLDRIEAVAKTIRSRFFTMDVAKTKAGDWLIVELGDAQVAGLPDNADIAAFYSRIAERWPEQ